MARTAFTVGAILQGTVLGYLLLRALVQLLQSNTGAQMFRYQGF